MNLYSNIKSPISLLNNNSWLHCQSYHLMDYFQQPDFPLFKCGGAFTRIQTCIIIDNGCNDHFWPFIWIIKLCQPFSFFTKKFSSSHYLNIINLFINIIIWRTLLFNEQCIFHAPPPALLLSFLGISDSYYYIAFFLWETPEKFKYNFCLFLLYGLSELEERGSKQ